MRRLQAQNQLRTVLKQYYKGIKSPIAWCTSAGPSEILRALGFQVYFPENHGAMLGATRTAERFIPKAHQAGFGGEVCSYLTADIGAWLSGISLLKPAYGLKGVPKPDLIVYNTNQCREVAEWFNFYGREYGCPVVGIYPPRHLEKVTADDLSQVVAQFQGLIATAEEIVGHSLDPERLKEVAELSYQASSLWQQVLHTARNTPAPLTFFDGTILMAPIVVWRGTRQCVEYYEQTLAELQGLIEAEQGAVPNERLRLYWDGMPIWGRLRWFSELCADNGAAVVASTYCNSWVFSGIDPDDVLTSLAVAYTEIFINRGEETKLAYLQEMLELYRIDGVVFHDSKTCFANSNSRFGMPARLQKETGIGTLVIDGDLNDLRFFSDGQSQTKLETFFEQLQMRA